MRVILATALLLALAGCAASPELEGIDLPPASMPDDIDSAQWAVPFSHEFGADFWTEGPHVYQLVLDCPGIGQDRVESQLVAFRAGSEHPTIDQPVHLRLSGLSTTTMGTPDLQFVSTMQDTIALLTVVGITEGQRDAAEECTGEVRWDDGQSAPLLPGEPFRP